MGKICLCCDEEFKPYSSRPDQGYCGKAGCQRERRRRWHQEKMKTDPVYRQGQLDCQKNWREQHPDYWRRYRADHADYRDHNRDRQRERNRLRRTPCSDEVIAKMDELPVCNHIESGRYILMPFREGMIAKMDELIVQLAVIAERSPVEVRAGP